MMGFADKCSEKERAMFTALGLEGQLWLPLPVSSFYEMAVRRVFLGNMQGPAVESLRRCVKALDTGKIYRGTFEWDSLIQLEG